MNNLHKLYENTGFVELVELEDGSVLVTADIQDVRRILEENDFEYRLEEDGFIVTDSFEEVLEEFQEYDLVVPSAVDILEATAKRKIVIRKGKRKVLFQCKPGQKKVGPRRCMKRSSRDLMKMKRRARRAARKARRKRSQANRRRKISLRRRPHKSHHKEEKHHKHKK